MHGSIFSQRRSGSDSEQGVDGWLLYDFRKSNVLAERVLAGQKNSRRWAYFIPQEGTPRKLVHRIETGVLDGLPGEKGFISSGVSSKRDGGAGGGQQKNRHGIRSGMVTLIFRVSMAGPLN